MRFLADGPSLPVELLEQRDRENKRGSGIRESWRSPFQAGSHRLLKRHFLGVFESINLWGRAHSQQTR